MDAPGRVVHPLLVVALVLVAAVGYLAGSRRSGGSSAVADPPSVSRSLDNAGLLIEYPADWRQAASPPSVPGLALIAPVAIGPAKAADGGLLTGELPAGEPGPLPAAFLARLPRLPHAEVVNLVSTQAYRYGELRVRGYGDSLDLYVLPAAAGGDRVIACFGRTRLVRAAQECERIAGEVAVTGQPTSTLTPEPTYARALSEVLSTLAWARRRTRSQMSSESSPSALAAAASGLAGRMSSAAASLAALQAPQPASAAGSALASALRRAGRTYSALAAAAGAEELAAYRSARAAVAPAEAAVDRALADLVLLGYG
ncbi:MAG TPA: hypothetical protein VN618_09270 [Solirubrobacteraceae bacterium]|nr:hypothetical protein [Solirubrobacteraceae bacterium]